MGYINDQKEILKSEVKPKISYTGLIKDLKEKARENRDKTVPLVKGDVDKDEIIKRYTGLKRVMLIALSFIAISFFKLITVTNIPAVIICTILILMMSLFYYKYAYIAWRTRRFLDDNMQEKELLTMQDFNSALQLNPSEIMPKKIK